MCLVIKYCVNNQLETELCNYRGEGNSHLVLSVPNSRKILRINKNQSECDYQDIINKFYEKIITPLLSVYNEESIGIILPDVEENNIFIKSMEHLRSEYRKTKLLELRCGRLFEDYTYLAKFSHLSSPSDTYAVEIKPKQGFLRPDNKCAYYEKQNLKLQTGRISTISDYCPLDLFSGDENRILKAIENLIKNPQNNFQMFKNGLSIYGCNSSLDDYNTIRKELSDTLKEIINLPKILQMMLVKHIENNTCKECCNKSLGGKPSPERNVLQRIYELQALANRICIDEFDIEMGRFDYVDYFLNDLEKNECPRCVLLEYYYKEEACAMEKFVLHYIAKLFKDCSIMIAFKFIDNNLVVGKGDDLNRHLLKLENYLLVFDIKIMDLSPKPHKTKKE